MVTAARFERGPIALLDNAAQPAPHGSRVRVHSDRERALAVLPELGKGQGMPPAERPGTRKTVRRARDEAPVGAGSRPATGRRLVGVGAAVANFLPIATLPGKGKVAA
jgi:K+-sensing histidine kinase KdpD